jgi:MFS superfamily sulfate permease-like transporter
MNSNQSLNGNGYKKTLDIKAGLVVFLIALPLSLGISLASGAPPSAGIISAILGGILGAYLGGSYLTINGPAAGLIVVVLSAIQSLGAGDPMVGFRRMLACVVIVGVLQIISGLIKAGRFAALFPLSVVHGMLTAIGLIIIIKQAHTFLGHKAQGSIFATLLQVPVSLLNLVPESALIGLVALLLLLAYPHIKSGFAKIIPAPLVVVIVGIVMAMFLHPAAMVSIPTNPSELIIMPMFDVITSYQSLLSIFTIFFVASLESILSVSAVDKLDPLGRESNYNRELWSKGIVNIACGLLGGLPIIAEIVRSSANITQGARTPLANFSHGIFIFVFVMIFPQVLNSIPMSALAAILVLVGYRLSQPKQFIEMWHLGIGSFLAFTTTIVVTLTEDLLIGIFAGVLVEAAFSLIMGAKIKSLISPTFNLQENGNEAILSFEDSLTFFSILKQKDIIAKASRYRHIKFDFTKVSFMDATSISLFFRESAKLEKTGALVFITVPAQYELIYKQIKEH